MRKFVLLWSSLFLTLVVLSYTITMSIFFSAWFLLLFFPSLLMIINLIHKIGAKAKVFTQAQKSYLSDVVYRQGYIAFFMSIFCALYVMRHHYEQCIYAITLGIALFCFFGLCIALRNYLNSFNSLWKMENN